MAKEKEALETTPKSRLRAANPRAANRQALRRGGLALLALLVLVIAAAYFFVQRTLPTIDGSLRAAGLSDKVEVLRDRWGVPHIYAQNTPDVFFAQGYVTAQDRLWQMELFRRVGRGTLSEIFGKATLEQDRFLRTLGLWRVAGQEAAQLDPDSRQILEAFAAGVNAFLTTHADRLPLEFTILGFKPEPWMPADSLTFAKVMALDLSGNWRQELLRARLVARFGPDVLNELAPPYPAGAPIVVSREVAFGDFAGATLPDLGPLGQPFGSGSDLGSNNWVAAGRLTNTAAPLLANDPHLRVQMPALWYEVHLSIPSNPRQQGIEVIGASLPGIPGVVIGHNDRIAWGMTNLGADVQDLYVEKLNPGNALQYEYEGSWQDMRVTDEVIKLRGESEPVELRVLRTRHGPLLNGVVKGLGQPVALRWTALGPGETFRALTLVNRARSWDDFRAALRYFVVPSQNFVYADVDGNIGYIAPGLIPIRSASDGLLPSPGWTGEYEWTSYIAFDQLPSAYNPPQGFLFSANNRVADDNYPYSISYDWNPGYRARRIAELMQGQTAVDIPTFRRIQLDAQSPPLIELAVFLLSIEYPPTQSSDDRYVELALDYVREWDGNLNTDSIGGTVLEVTLNRLLTNVYADAMGPELFKDYADSEAAVPSILANLRGEHSQWFGAVRAASPDRDEVALRSLREAVRELRQRFGDDVKGWRWGRLHTVTFAHPLGELQPLDRLFNLGPFEAAGSRNTVNQNAFAQSKPFAVSKLPSLRQIIDLDDFDRSLFVHTTGQSGQPFSRHFGDLAQLWTRGDYHPLLFSRAKVEAAREGRLVLTP